MKKIISLFMAFVMLLSVTAGLNLTVYAETATSGKCGENVYWNYDESSKTLTISGKGAMDDYGSYDPAYSSYLYKVNNINIVIKEGVTSVGSYAFFNHHMYCNNVRIPLSVTNIKKFAFDEDLRVPEMDEELEMYSYNSESLVAYSNEYVINNVLYAGNEEQWKKISIDVGNETLTNAKIHYNSPLPEQPDDNTSQDISANFKIGRDNNSYCHYDNSYVQQKTSGFVDVKNYKIDKEYYKKLVNNSSLIEKIQIKKMMNRVWEGSCYGIATTLGMVHQNIIPLSSITSKLNVKDYYHLRYPYKEIAESYIPPFFKFCDN